MTYFFWHESKYPNEGTRISDYILRAEHPSNTPFVQNLLKRREDYAMDAFRAQVYRQSRGMLLEPVRYQCMS